MKPQKLPLDSQLCFSLYAASYGGQPHLQADA